MKSCDNELIVKSVLVDLLLMNGVFFLLFQTVFHTRFFGHTDVFFPLLALIPSLLVSSFFVHNPFSYFKKEFGTSTEMLPGNKHDIPFRFAYSSTDRIANRTASRIANRKVDCTTHRTSNRNIVIILKTIFSSNAFKNAGYIVLLQFLTL